MKYLEIKLVITPSDPWKEIFTSMMADAGCDSFMDGEGEDDLLCYIPKKDYDESAIKEIVEDHGFSDVKVAWSVQEMPDKDWNAEWEANYTPVMIADRCYVRAPFHPACQDAEYEIIIEPKMSFGTAKHATTYQMAEYVLETDVKGKALLDMGAGTGVLAILAHMRGANPVTAIDIDEWAYRNGLENVEHNHCPEVKVLLGDASILGDEKYDIILANINRNILLNDIPTYVGCLNEHGLLFMSGFYDGKDLEAIKECCEKNGMQYVSHKVKDQWVAAKFCKA
ncbi:MAG: 50S ribosomal protein L11 methyltransferase [Bacteroidales bacterium]|nr:50S ribosomal protein L11 methyltransferase [Bacteroidales bacterium]